MKESEISQVALGLAVLCVRNTSIEDIHSGTEPASPAGDLSDVRVVTPSGEIPWNAASRISNEEMKAFMIEVVDRLYTSLLRLDDPAFVKRVTQYASKATIGWNEPRHLAGWFTGKYNEQKNLTEVDENRSRSGE